MRPQNNQINSGIVALTSACHGAIKGQIFLHGARSFKDSTYNLQNLTRKSNNAYGLLEVQGFPNEIPDPKETRVACS
jgi:hypothetical protein